MEQQRPDTTGPPADELHYLTTRAARGVLTLILREGMVRLISIGGSIALARVLAPEMFGLYVMVWFAVHFFSHFSDIGLGEALVRKQGTPSELECRTVFTMHLTLMGSLLAVIFFAAPYVRTVYHAPDEAIWLIRTMGLALFVNSLRTIPAMKLERSLRYDRLSAVDVAETLAFQSLALPLAFAGSGTWSLVAASAASSAIGTVATYLLSPWRPSLAWHWPSAQALLRFGVPYQAQCFVHLAKDNLTPSLGGILLGTTAVGYLNWAHSTARLPMVFGDMVNRVSLPAFARLLGDKALLQTAVHDGLRWAAIMTFGPLSLLMGLAPQVIVYVYTDKWLPALPALYLFGLEMTSGLLTLILMPLLQAAGRMRAALRLSLIWTGAIWLVGVVLIASPLGFAGIAVAYAAGAALAALMIVKEVQAVVKVAIWPAIRDPLLAASASFLVVFPLGRYAVNGLLSLVFAVLIGVILYALALYTLSGQQVFLEAKRLALGRR